MTEWNSVISVMLPLCFLLYLVMDIQTGEAHCHAQGLNPNLSGDVQNYTNALYRIDAHSS